MIAGVDMQSGLWFRHSAADKLLSHREAGDDEARKDQDQGVYDAMWHATKLTILAGLVHAIPDRTPVSGFPATIWIY